ncbi:MAG TPA: sigma-70 family RNA polymerase sigma factor [Acidimicrobiales bacterium]|nr:sigma-70 family RNA polymerase sigma factor [Acidimicrobiales bacterium]
MTDAATDFDLVEAAKAGDRAAFGHLVRRHGARLLALARQVVGPDGAEDAVQEAMIDAWRGIGGFAGNAAVGTWLYRITLNRCLAERRRRRPDVVDAEPLELLRRWEDPDYAVDPAVVAARRSQAEVVRRLLDLLPERYRNAVVLHDGQGLSASEVAEVLGIPLGTAKSHIRRSRMALFSLLAEDDRGLLEEAR